MIKAVIGIFILGLAIYLGGCASDPQNPDEIQKKADRIKAGGLIAFSALIVVALILNWR